MKKIIWIFNFFLVAGIFSIFSACGESLELNEGEAKKIISEYNKYPKPVSTIIVEAEDHKFGGGIRKLIADGYIQKNSKKIMASIPDYLPTEKGKRYIEQVLYDTTWKRYHYHGAVVQQSIGSIDEILIDTENKTAIVAYSTKIEPLEPFYSLVCVSFSCKYSSERGGEEFEREKSFKSELTLKKYDKGWRVVSL